MGRGWGCNEDTAPRRGRNDRICDLSLHIIDYVIDTME